MILHTNANVWHLYDRTLVIFDGENNGYLSQLNERRFIHRFDLTYFLNQQFLSEQ